jgi:uncharacterized protein (TIGR02271 family)
MADDTPDRDQIVVPVHEEVVEPVRREIDAGAVRIATRVETTPTEWETTLRRDNVTIERVPVGQPVEAVPEARWEDDTLIVPVLEEEIVVSRRLVLREEIRITRWSEARAVSGTEPLRREIVDIERVGPDEATADTAP